LLLVCVNWLTVWTIVPQKFGGAKLIEDCSVGQSDDRFKKSSTKQQKKDYSYTVLELSQVFLSKYSVGSVIDSFCRIAGIVLLFFAISVLTWACQRYIVGLDRFEYMTLSKIMCSSVNSADHEKDMAVIIVENHDDCVRTCSELRCGRPQSHGVRADRPFNKQPLDNKFVNRFHSKSFISADNGRSYNEATTGMSSSGYYSGVSSNYSQHTYRSQIVGLQRSNFFGVDSVPDKTTDSVHLSKLQCLQPQGLQRSNILGVDSVSDKAVDNEHLSNPQDNAVHHGYKEACVPIGQHKQQSIRKNDWNPPADVWKKEETVHEPATKSGYTKPTYAVLIGNTVMVYDTIRFTSLPKYSKFMVKERQRDSLGVTRIKLALKHCEEKR